MHAPANSRKLNVSNLGSPSWRSLVTLQPPLHCLIWAHSGRLPQLHGHVQQLKSWETSWSSAIWISRLPWMKALFHLSAPSTPCHRWNFWLFISSLTQTSLQDSFVPCAPLVEHWSSSSRRKMVLFNFVLISEDSTRYPRRISTCFPSFQTCLTHHKKHKSTWKSISGTHTT